MAATWQRFLQALTQQPDLWINICTEVQRKQLEVTSSLGAKNEEKEEIVSPSKGDRRFSDKQWRENPFFSMLMQNYLLNSEAVREVVEKVNLPESDKKLLRFSIGQYVDAMSPSNFPATNPTVMEEAMQTGGENFVTGMVGMAIDEKSPHTSGHCYRVTEVTMMLADAVEQEMVDFEMSTSDREALKMAALLHDVGKIITPDHILEKPTKLFTLTDRIEHLIDRLHMWRISEELDALKKNVIAAGRKDLLPSSKESDVSQLNSDIDLLKEVNTGNLFMDEEVMNKLENISSRVIAHTQPPTEKNDEQDGREKVVARKDLSDLQILRGTLNPRERKIMEEHASITIRLLSSIPWPKKYSRVVEYAGNHHEKMNGAGYPNRLSASELSIPSRILGIADRFEGLSAPDRPYRSRKMTLSRVLDIMQSMSDEGEIDADLYRIFLKSKIHLKYGHQFLDNALVDCA